MQMVTPYHNPELISHIRHTGIQNQVVMARALDLHLLTEAKQCQQLDNALISLLHKAVHFDFTGQIITAADTPHYRGAFQFEEAAYIAGFQPPKVYAFDPKQFPGYEHTMTHQSGSALENHNTFSTWIFKI